MSFKPRQSQQIIVIQRPMLWVFSLLVLLTAMLVSIWLIYDYGLYRGGYDQSTAQATILQLHKKLAAAKAEKLETQRQTAMLERNRQIDNDAAQQLKENIVNVQNENLALKKELIFYKSIVAPEQGKRSLAIQTIQLKADVDNKDRYRYKIMLSQHGHNDRFARGTINVTIKGSKQGRHRVLKLTDISNATKKTMNFGFRYFQNFEGMMTLPEAFQPDSIHIMVKPKTARIKPVDEQFTWSDLTAGGV